jgi:hypothetical protein
MMSRKTLLNFSLGFVLALAGATMLYISQFKEGIKTSAQVGATPYRSTWTATKVLTTYYTTEDSNRWSRRTQVSQPVILGVWEWKVDGAVGNSKTFSETWLRRL